jgi:transposase InsO family protein
VILGLIDEAVAAGARQSRACEVLGLDPRTVQRWRSHGIGDDRRAGPLQKPRNALSAPEKGQILEIANSPEYRDLSPKQIVPKLADRGRYVASESTFYRVLREAGQMQHREPSRSPTVRHRPKTYTATGPNQVWSWDITYLRAPIRGTFFRLYMVVDIWSRKIVGYAVHEDESSCFAAAMITAACASEGVLEHQLTLHSDNGAPMKGATMLATLQELGVVPSFSRPAVSNDNPYSEALFRTAKYRPEFPRKPFESLEAARAWVTAFVRWYNTEHLHSAISFTTPADRHCGRDVEILARRDEVIRSARRRHPERWAGPVRDCARVEAVTLNPKPEEEPRRRVA